MATIYKSRNSISLFGRQSILPIVPIYKSRNSISLFGERCTGRNGRSTKVEILLVYLANEISKNELYLQK